MVCGCWWWVVGGFVTSELGVGDTGLWVLIKKTQLWPSFKLPIGLTLWYIFGLELHQISLGFSGVNLASGVFSYYAHLFYATTLATRESRDPLADYREYPRQDYFLGQWAHPRSPAEFSYHDNHNGNCSLCAGTTELDRW